MILKKGLHRLLGLSVVFNPVFWGGCGCGCVRACVCVMFESITPVPASYIMCAVCVLYHHECSNQSDSIWPLVFDRMSM